MGLEIEYVQGPNSSVVDDIATFADSTGKVIKDSGQTIAQVITAAVAAAVAAAGIAFSGCRLVRSGALSVSQNTTTAIPWDGETWDTDNYHSNSVNPTRITIPAGGAGKYHFQAQVMDSAHAQDAYTQLRLMKNGSEVAHGGRCTYGCAPGGSVNVVNPFKTDVEADLILAAGDVIEVEAYAANNGITQAMVLNVASSAYCFVICQKLSS